MARVATVVPAESDILCEGCGYTLNGLPESSNCPECGKPIAESIGTHRSASQFEQTPSAMAFLATDRLIMLSPKLFFSQLATRSSSDHASLFAGVHRMIASALFSIAATGHLLFLLHAMNRYHSWVESTFIALLAFLAATPAIYLLLKGLTRLATWLSAIEAKYWGMRLPHAVVGRGLQFHAAHYVPVGVLSVMVVWGYQLVVFMLDGSHRYDDTYLYTLCGVVIVSAGYLFQTYWIAMRAMMYANR